MDITNITGLSGVKGSVEKTNQVEIIMEGTKKVQMNVSRFMSTLGYRRIFGNQFTRYKTGETEYTDVMVAVYAPPKAVVTETATEQ